MASHNAPKATTETPGLVLARADAASTVAAALPILSPCLKTALPGKAKGLWVTRLCLRFGVRPGGTSASVAQHAVDSVLHRVRGVAEASPASDADSRALTRRHDSQAKQTQLCWRFHVRPVQHAMNLQATPFFLHVESSALQSLCRLGGSPTAFLSRSTQVTK